MFFSIKNKKNKGISLFEVLIYVAIFAFVSILAVNMFISISKAFSEIRANHELSRNGFLVMEKITREVKWAQSIVLESSVFDSNPGSLSVSGIDNFDSSLRNVSFSLNSGKIYFFENGVNEGSLLTSNVSVSSFIIRNISTTFSSAVKIELKLLFSRVGVQKEKSFYTTIILREGI